MFEYLKQQYISFFNTSFGRFLAFCLYLPNRILAAAFSLTMMFLFKLVESFPLVILLAIFNIAVMLLVVVFPFLVFFILVLSPFCPEDFKSSLQVLGWVFILLVGAMLISVGVNLAVVIINAGHFGRTSIESVIVALRLGFTGVFALIDKRYRFDIKALQLIYVIVRYGIRNFLGTNLPGYDLAAHVFAIVENENRNGYGNQLNMSGADYANLQLSDIEVNDIKNHPILSEQEIVILKILELVIEEEVKETVEDLFLKLKAITERLEEPCSISFDVPTPKHAVVLFKQYQEIQGGEWKPIAGTSRIFDETQLKTAVSKSIRHPLAAEPLLNPTKHIINEKEYKTRYKFHPLYPTKYKKDDEDNQPPTEPPISQELNCIVAKLKAYLPVKKDDTNDNTNDNTNVTTLPVVSQAENRLGIFFPIIPHNSAQMNNVELREKRLARFGVTE